MTRRLRTYAHTLLEAARRFVRRRAHEEGGCICPCCGLRCEEYEFGLTQQTARSLVALYRLGGVGHIDDWVQSKNKSGGVATRLKLHRLVESIPPTSENRQPFGRSGFYRLTEVGRRWLTEPGFRIAKKAYSFNNTVTRYSDETCTIQEVLRDDDWSHEDVRANTYPD